MKNNIEQILNNFIIENNKKLNNHKQNLDEIKIISAPKNYLINVNDIQKAISISNNKPQFF